jgi:hypothetical protein
MYKAKDARDAVGTLRMQHGMAAPASSLTTVSALRPHAGGINEPFHVESISSLRYHDVPKAE